MEEEEQEEDSQENKDSKLARLSLMTVNLLYFYIIIFARKKGEFCLFSLFFTSTNNLIFSKINIKDDQLIAK